VKRADKELSHILC